MESVISFRGMTEEEYENYYTSAISMYASRLIKCGKATNENALVLSDNDFNEALPFGFRTPNAYFYIILNVDNDEIGFIWYIELQNSIAYIGDFLIYEEHRRKGYGLQVLKCLEEEFTSRGNKAAALNVFDFNTGARNLYEKMGFKEIKIEQGCVQMAKSLVP